MLKGIRRRQKAAEIKLSCTLLCIIKSSGAVQCIFLSCLFSKGLQLLEDFILLEVSESHGEVPEFTASVAVLYSAVNLSGKSDASAVIEMLFTKGEH